MRKFRALGPTCYTVQWTGENLDEVRQFLDEFFSGMRAYEEKCDLVVVNLNDMELVDVIPYNDWLLCEAHDEENVFQTFCTEELFNSFREEL